MAYARMRAVCRGSLICDFAEYYHIYDIDSFGVQQAAILACGLPADSRTLRHLTGQKMPLDTYLYAAILDSLQNLTYLYLKRNYKGKHKKPESLVKKLSGADQSDGDIRAFNSAEDFEQTRQKLLRGKKYG